MCQPLLPPWAPGHANGCWEPGWEGPSWEATHRRVPGKDAQAESGVPGGEGATSRLHLRPGLRWGEVPVTSSGAAEPREAGSQSSGTH